MDDRKPKRYGDDTMKMNTRMLDMNTHEIELDDMKEILDRHNPLKIRCWSYGDVAYLSIEYEIVMNMTLYSEFRPKEEIIRLLRDTKNLTKTSMHETRSSILEVDKKSTPYAPFAEEKEEDFSFNDLLTGEE